MAIKYFKIDDLVRIAYAGGGFRVDASSFRTEDLVRIAHAASNHKAIIYMTGLSLHSVDDLVRIGAAGKGSVIFED